jgi:hypothetical protein
MLSEIIHLQNTKDFASAKEIFKVGDEIKEVYQVGGEYHSLVTGLRFKVIKVTNKGVYGDDCKRLCPLKDLLSNDIELTREGQKVLFRIEAIANVTTPYRWTRYGNQ